MKKKKCECGDNYVISFGHSKCWRCRANTSVKCECGRMMQPIHGHDKCYVCRAAETTLKTCECGRKYKPSYGNGMCWQCKRDGGGYDWANLEIKSKICECGNKYHPGWGHDKCWSCRKREYKRDYSHKNYPENKEKYKEWFQEWYAKNKTAWFKSMMKWRAENLDWYRTYQRFYQWLYVRGIKLGECTQEERDKYCDIYFGFEPKCPEMKRKYGLERLKK